MNREILSRGKRKDNGEWVYGFYWKDIWDEKGIWGNGESCYIFCDGEDYPVIPSTVGLYTGLTDKNGVKIFEGDIIKHYCYSDDNIFDIGRIFWCENKFCWKRTSCGNSNESYFIARDCVYEIIGNVHDNPELLKGGEGNG